MSCLMLVDRLGDSRTCALAHQLAASGLSVALTVQLELASEAMCEWNHAGYTLILLAHLLALARTLLLARAMVQ